MSEPFMIQFPGFMLALRGDAPLVDRLLIVGRAGGVGDSYALFTDRFLAEDYLADRPGLEGHEIVELTCAEFVELLRQRPAEVTKVGFDLPVQGRGGRKVAGAFIENLIQQLEGSDQ